MSIRNGLSPLSMVKPHSEGILVGGKALTYTCVRESEHIREREADGMTEREREGNFFFHFSPQLVLLLLPSNYNLL